MSRTSPLDARAWRYLAAHRVAHLTTVDQAGIPSSTIPEELAARRMNLGTQTLQAQIASAFFAQPGDVVVLSIQADVTHVLRRHRPAGYYFGDAGLGSAGATRGSDEQ